MHTNFEVRLISEREGGWGYLGVFGGIPPSGAAAAPQPSPVMDSPH